MKGKRYVQEYYFKLSNGNYLWMQTLDEESGFEMQERDADIVENDIKVKAKKFPYVNKKWQEDDRDERFFLLTVRRDMFKIKIE